MTKVNEEKIREKLHQLGDKSDIAHKTTADGVVYRLFDVITEAKNKGYTWRELAEFMGQHDLKISHHRLSQAYREAKVIKEKEAQQLQEEKKQQELRKKEQADQKKREAAKKKQEEEAKLLS